MRVSQGFYRFVSEPRRLIVTVTCLLLSVLCHLEYFLAGFAWVPGEATVGYIPAFALGIASIHWWRQDDATGRDADQGDGTSSAS